MTIQEILKSEDTFRYQLLSRLKGDCDYYFGYGGRSNNVLWAKDVQGQIKTMKELWKSFKENAKPEWLTWEEILNYESEMIN